VRAEELLIFLCALPEFIVAVINSHKLQPSTRMHPFAALAPPSRQRIHPASSIPF
jgi:hypothetical protein